MFQVQVWDDLTGSWLEVDTTDTLADARRLIGDGWPRRVQVQGRARIIETRCVDVYIDGALVAASDRGVWDAI